jgi:arylsulfatase A-like enzyme
MTDDAGYADIGSYGAPDIRTPNIDSLARDGVRLTDFYANAMSCTPTRVGLISGRYQQRCGMEFVIPAPGLAGSEKRVAGLAAFTAAAAETERVRNCAHRQVARRVQAGVLTARARL